MSATVIDGSAVATGRSFEPNQQVARPRSSADTRLERPCLATVLAETTPRRAPTCG